MALASLPWSSSTRFHLHVLPRSVAKNVSRLLKSQQAICKASFVTYMRRINRRLVKAFASGVYMYLNHVYQWVMLENDAPDSFWHVDQ